MKRHIVLTSAVGALLAFLAIPAGASASVSTTWSSSSDGTAVAAVGAPQGLYVLPAVPSAADGCRSLKGTRLPNGSHAPATWFACTSPTAFSFPASVSGQTISVRYFYGTSRAGSISYGANPFYVSPPL